MATPGTIESSQFERLMAAIDESKSSFKRDLSLLKEEVKKGQEETAERMVKRARREQPYEFAKKGNRCQHEFNEKVSGILEDALASTSSGDPASEKIRKLLEEGVKIIEERQKLIKMADRSEFGWGLVSEYQADELAENSDDEKRIQKAEKAAEKKLNKRKKRENQKAGTQRKNVGARQPAMLTPFEPVRLGFSTGPSAQFRQPMIRPLGPCHNCGEMGHLRRTCPKPLGQSTAKYPFLLSGERVLSPFGEEGVSTSESACDNEVVEQWLETKDSEVRDWEVYEEDVNVVLSVKGRLCSRIEFWRDSLRANNTVLNWIEHGYILPLSAVPDPYKKVNHSSTLTDLEFVNGAVCELSQSGCIRSTLEVPLVCSPLMVVTNAKGKKRLVINLKYLNSFVVKEKFKYEDIRTLISIAEIT